MDVKPLCILQMRSGSTRLPNKMLLPFGGETLAERGWRLACEAFGEDNCVVAIPANDLTMFQELVRIGATIFEHNGDEADVLGRFHACAHRYRWHPASVLHRWTSDDPFKVPSACRRVAAGERLPVEIGGEAFTLAQLDRASELTPRQHTIFDVFSGTMSVSYNANREHLTYILFPDSPPPPAPLGCWTVDTQADYEAALARLEAEATGVERAKWDGCCLACTETNDCIRHEKRTGDISDPQMGELHSPFAGGPWSPC